MTPDYLDRLARSEPLDSWRPDELVAALAMVEGLDATRKRWEPSTVVVDIRYARYRRRLRQELDHRIADDNLL
ncbi:hypothetical protein GCM10009745_55830 [Kribbella yunnanensis]|uniref:Uncharacterized protein n=1 Tax=Kribbella yunnanensis TaxID=190194 RepID=A0ABN2IAY3_9ACTN